MKVRKAVITAAGWGTRFLPITRSQPKEMLPLVNKPLIHYAVQEAIDAGIQQVVIVTARNKRAIEDYFDRSFELEHLLETKGKTELLSEMRRISDMVNICYIRQKEQLGLGHAVLTAKEIIAGEPFAVILPDDIIDSRVPVLKQMIEVYERYQASVVAVEKVVPKDTTKYGMIAARKESNGIFQVTGLVEKPEPENAPSDLGVVGRYILTPEIFAALESTPTGKGGEIQLTDALQILREKQTMYACAFKGVRYDTGNPLGWLKAAVAYGLKDSAIAAEFKEYLHNLP